MKAVFISLLAVFAVNSVCSYPNAKQSMRNFDDGESNPNLQNILNESSNPVLTKVAKESEEPKQGIIINDKSERAFKNALSEEVEESVASAKIENSGEISKDFNSNESDKQFQDVINEEKLALSTKDTGSKNSEQPLMYSVNEVSASLKVIMNTELEDPSVGVEIKNSGKSLQNNAEESLQTTANNKNADLLINTESGKSKQPLKNNAIEDPLERSNDISNKMAEHSSIVALSKSSKGVAAVKHKGNERPSIDVISEVSNESSKIVDGKDPKDQFMNVLNEKAEQPTKVVTNVASETLNIFKQLSSNIKDEKSEQPLNNVVGEESEDNVVVEESKDNVVGEESEGNVVGEESEDNVVGEEPEEYFNDQLNEKDIKEFQISAFHKSLKFIFSENLNEVLNSQHIYKLFENGFEKAFEEAFEDFSEENVFEEKKEIIKRTNGKSDFVISEEFTNSIKSVFSKFFEENFKEAVEDSLKETFENVFEYILEDLPKKSERVRESNEKVKRSVHLFDSGSSNDFKVDDATNSDSKDDNSVSIKNISDKHFVAQLIKNEPKPEEHLNDNNQLHFISRSTPQEMDKRTSRDHTFSGKRDFSSIIDDKDEFDGAKRPFVLFNGRNIPKEEKNEQEETIELTNKQMLTTQINKDRQHQALSGTPLIKFKDEIIQSGDKQHQAFLSGTPSVKVKDQLIQSGGLNKKLEVEVMVRKDHSENDVLVDLPTDKIKTINTKLLPLQDDVSKIQITSNLQDKSISFTKVDPLPSSTGEKAFNAPYHVNPKIQFHDTILNVNEENKDINQEIRTTKIDIVQEELYTPNGKIKKAPAATEVTYVGAVLEYEPYNQWTDEEQGYGVARQNALNIISYAETAKVQGADILVAPEYGIQSLDMQYNDTAKFITYTQYIPDPADNVIPCFLPNDTRHTEAIQILSCGAIDNAMYIVADMGEISPCTALNNALHPWKIETSDACPDTGYFTYNTQVVFDRSGTVIARYRKQNLYLEDYFTPGPLNDSTAIFVTDFDVVFTLQVCFDMVYEHPGYSNVNSYGIKDVAMSTAWVDELPYNLADDSQNGWSRGLGVNLLVSGYHLPERSKLGSGIFRSYSNDMPAYTYDKESGNVLIVSSVTTVAASSIPVSLPFAKTDRVPKTLNPVSSLKPIVNYNREVDSRAHPMVHQNLANYTSIVLASGNAGEDLTTSACSENNFCCGITYQYTGNLTYMLLVFSGQVPIGFGTYSTGSQSCGVAWCRGEHINTCAMVEMGLPESDAFGPFQLFSSSFSAEAVYPTGVKRDLNLIGNDVFNFDVNGNMFTLSAVEPVQDFLSASLCGRWYSNDSGK